MGTKIIHEVTGEQCSPVPWKYDTVGETTHALGGGEVSWNEASLELAFGRMKGVRKEHLNVCGDYIGILRFHSFLAPRLLLATLGRLSHLPYDP